MKNYFVLLLALAALAGVVLTGCTRKTDIPYDPDPVPQQIIIGMSDIRGIPEGVIFDRVVAEVKGLDWQVIGSMTAQVSGGKITINLPATIADDKLCKAPRDDYKDYAGWWPVAPAQLSDPTAKVAGLGDILAYSGDAVVGRLFLSDWDGTLEGRDGASYIYFHYADRPFTIAGINLYRAGERPSFRYEASFVKGWNSYANTSSTAVGSNPEGTLVTTTLDGVVDDLRWWFESR